MEEIILVDKNNAIIGYEEKIKTHLEGKLHRAFSAFIVNSKKEMLIQKRNLQKYHSGGLWTNACCSHPRKGEETSNGIHRRLKEEMGFDCKLSNIFDFQYKNSFDNGLTENEYDHVFLGTYEKEVFLNPKEADDFEWINLNKLVEDTKDNPHIYTCWFKIALPKVISFL